MLGEPEVIVWLLMQRPDQRRGQEELAARREHPVELAQRGRRVGDVLQDLCAQDGVERPLVERNAVEGRDNVDASRVGVRRVLPVERGVRAMVEQLPVGGVSRSCVEQARALVELP